MNQFGNAGKALEYHESTSTSNEYANQCLDLGGNNAQESMNLMHEIKRQIGRAPEFFVHSAATGKLLLKVPRPNVDVAAVMIFMLHLCSRN